MSVISGSMDPTFKVGDAVIMMAGAAESIQTGDVVVFGMEKLTAHRVLEVRETPEQRYFMTKGDANLAPDLDLVPQDLVYGEIVLAIPKAGHFLSIGATSSGKAALIISPLILLLVHRRLERRRQKMAPLLWCYTSVSA